MWNRLISVDERHLLTTFNEYTHLAEYQADYVGNHWSYLTTDDEQSSHEDKFSLNNLFGDHFNNRWCSMQMNTEVSLLLFLLDVFHVCWWIWMVDFQYRWEYFLILFVDSQLIIPQMIQSSFQINDDQSLQLDLYVVSFFSFDLMKNFFG